MRLSWYFLILAPLLGSLLAATTSQPCSCTSNTTIRRSTIRRTYTGSALCTSLKLKPTCPVVPAKATSSAKITSSAKATSSAIATSSVRTSSSIKSSSTTSSHVSTSSRVSTTLSTSTRQSTTTSPSPSPCVNSGKRGLAYNDATLTEGFSLCGQNSKVSWSYNWYSSPYSANTPSSGYNPALRFTPMLWSAADDLTSVWNSNVANAISSYSADSVIAFNEPDGCGNGGSCMSVASAVSGYKNWVSPLKSKYPSLKLGAPAVTNGQSPMGLIYLGQFLGNCTSCNIDFIPIHWYGDASDVTGFQNYVASAYSAIQSKYPLWVTEFGCTSGTEAQVESFLKTVLPWLDGLSYVSRYAWFMDASGYLINSTTRALSTTGVIYNTA